MSGAIRFGAPWGRELRLTTAVTLLLLGAVFLTGLWNLICGAASAAWALISVPVAIVLATLPFMVRGYELSEGAIKVRRLGWQTVLPLAGLKSVSGQADAMQGTLRLLGNGGLFSFTGEFWNRRLGRYRALATDPRRAVVLRYPRRTIVITPHDPQQFIVRARTLLKVADFPE